MRAVYVIVMGIGWAYMAYVFAWKPLVAVVATIMTLTFAFYVSRVVGDDND